MGSQVLSWAVVSPGGVLSPSSCFQGPLLGRGSVDQERENGREGAEETRTREEGVDERKGLRRSRVGMRMMETERLSPPFGRDILLSPVTLASDRPESGLGFAAGQLCDCEPVTFPL